MLNRKIYTKEEIIRLIRTGSNLEKSEIYEIVYKKFASNIKTQIHRRFRTQLRSIDIEEIYVEAIEAFFLKVIAEQETTINNIGGFLSRAAFNISNNRYRKKANHHSEYDENIIQYIASSKINYEEKDFLELVKNIIRTELPQICKKIIEMTYQGFSQAEIANKIGVDWNVNKVTKKLAVCRNTLRVTLKKQNILRNE